MQNTVFLIAKSGKEITILSPCYARRKRKKLGTQKQLQEGKWCCKVTKTFASISNTFRQGSFQYMARLIYFFVTLLAAAGKTITPRPKALRESQGT